MSGNTLTTATEGLLQESGAPAVIPQVVVQDNTTKLVTQADGSVLVVNRVSGLAIDGTAPNTVSVVSARSVSTIVANTNVLSVSSPGVQGPPGASGADSGVPTVSFVSGHPTTLSKGTPVCLVSGQLRKATNAAPYNEVIGLVYEDNIISGMSGRVQTDGNMTLTQGQWEIATGLVGVLAEGETYWLQPGGGMAPSIVMAQGSFIAPVGYALSGTSFRIELNTQVLL